MRIAQVAPLSESVPPERYGGTERVVSYLTEELARRGHDVTLFASGDSTTSARLVSPCPVALWRGDTYAIPDVYHTILLELVTRELEGFDVVHFHLDYWHLPLMTRSHVPFVSTMHGRLDLPDLVPLYQLFPDAPVISISDAQRRPLPHLNWLRTIHHGLPADLLAFNPQPSDYLAFMGRTSREKGLDKAIDIAIRSEMPLKISAAVQPANREYFEAVIRPRLEHPLIEFVGELGGRDKEVFLQNARALLFPIDWPEPFGLVMIEAMACGTPVIAFPSGSVPEVLREGVSGFVVNDVDEAVEAVGRLEAIDRASVRAEFDARFTVERMVDEHLALYEELVRGHQDAAEMRRKPAVRRLHDMAHPGVDRTALPYVSDADALSSGIEAGGPSWNGESS